MPWTIHQGDALETLRGMDAISFDAVLCDPPYGLSFMGKAWDHGVPSAEVWAEVLRVLKPGAFLLAFGGTRTFHRLTCAIEDAGFEIRDCAMWLYGSGFPKSMNIGKVIDKASRGVPQGGPDPTSPNHGKFKGGCTEESPDGRGFGAGPGAFMRELGDREARALVDEAKPWEGYGTALKPAWEPCIVAMKPLDGTFAENALEHGVAGLNIDAGRIGTTGATKRGGQAEYPKNPDGTEDRSGCWARTGHAIVPLDAGRWPANLILDAEAGAILDEQTGDLGKSSGGTAKAGKFKGQYGTFAGDNPGSSAGGLGDSGGASRFFYCAKASRRERGVGNNHPCVKPLDLNRYLASLILPPKRDTPRRILVPFSGSGSEMIGAMLAGWDEGLGIELDAEYAAMARRRIEKYAPLSGPLFKETT